ncbi:MAG TPA: hypothetical protein VMM17_05670 [Gemmatimonadaceae bacterium]|nr:hypothetical protein [Gemmatimonadaceae bacterium]
MAAIERAEGRVILEGRLGCHVCGAQFPIAGGVASFGPAQRMESVDASGDADALRIAALLGLQSASGVVVLHGNAASAAGRLLQMLPVSVLAVNPTAPLLPQERFGVVRAASGMPLRSGVATGVALAGETVSTADPARVLRAGGRLLAPVRATLPVGLTELARDEREWVAVKTGSPEAIQLMRR